MPLALTSPQFQPSSQSNHTCHSPTRSHPYTCLRVPIIPNASASLSLPQIPTVTPYSTPIPTCINSSPSQPLILPFPIPETTTSKIDNNNSPLSTRDPVVHHYRPSTFPMPHASSQPSNLPIFHPHPSQPSSTSTIHTQPSFPMLLNHVTNHLADKVLSHGDGHDSGPSNHNYNRGGNGKPRSPI
ncbi:hypothetical protein VNO78_11749 [Psophocarpus tetragonolobus]|uniref:Uncharacterized protein n=1 Tax=Psophocarpus tetragonolobus TaxID=3891 RepID=A0AAN9XP05_PSOTE